MRALTVVLFLALSTAAFAQGTDEKQLMIESERRFHALLRGTGAASAASPEIDVTYYFLNLKVSTPPDPTLLSGTVEIRSVNRSDSLGRVVLDLMNFLTVDSVLVGGARAPFSQQPSTLTITLDRIYRRDERIALAVTYHGIPAATGFGSFFFSQHAGTPWVWSLSEPYGSRDWWPCKDHPLDKADSADIWITCDARFRAGSNGTLREVVDNGNGTKTWRWAERYPIASYLVSIAVTDFAEQVSWFRYSPVDSMPVVNYVLPELLPTALLTLPKVLDALRIFSDAYGLYPFIREKYGHSSMGQGGAMEHQTMTSTTNFAEYTLAHELAHQWFGDMITCRTWVDLWLNEGFASYSEALYAEREYGSDAYRGYMRTFFSRAKTSTDPIRLQDTSSIPRLFSASGVYSKGASVLHMLRHVFGDSVFFRALKAYAGDPALRYGTASSDDFRDVCERVSGLQLGGFFGQWLDGIGYPSYFYSWTGKADAAGGWNVVLSISQSNAAGAGTVFLMPLDVHVSGAVWDTTVTVANTAAFQEFTLHFPVQVQDLRLDPEGWVLADKTNLNDASLPLAFQLYPNYPNPFNPATTIPFALPHRSSVTLTIHNVLGEEVARLVDGRLEAGRHEVRWDGTMEGGAHSPSGVYFYYLRSDEGFRTGRMVMAK
jgi:aminopeptidase N